MSNPNVKTVHIEYDIDVVNFAIHCGWKPETFIGDFGSIENVVDNLQQRANCSVEEAMHQCRQMIATDVEEYLENRMGKRK